MVITVSGAAGTGKSTLAKALAEQLGYKYVCAGNLIRDLAAEHKLDVVHFGEYLKKHPELDREIDERVVAAAEDGNCVLEGRLTAWFMWQRKIPAFKVLLQTSPEVAAARIVQREGGDLEAEMQKAAEREKTNWQRYAELYGVSKEDEHWYDLVLNTDHKDIPTVLKIVGEAVKQA